MIALTNAILVGDELIRGKTLYLESGRIYAITDEVLQADEVIDMNGCYLAPGFIDIHTHGAGNSDYMDGTLEAVETAAAVQLSHGCTTVVPTTLSYGMESVANAVELVRQAAQNKMLPNLPGVHLEGPYFSKNQAGAQDPRYITPPVPAEYTAFLRDHGNFVKRWSFAPELPGAAEFCAALLRSGISPSVGHSDAAYADVKRVYDLGCRCVTHLYSGMSTIVRKNAYRVLGVVESAYLLEDMMVEVIADGKHLPPELLRLVYQLKGPDRICLITDSMRGAGMAEGPTVLGRREDGVPCVIEDGVAKLLDRSAFAGSVATFDRLVRVMYHDAAVPLTDCIKMASATPAKVLGLQSQKGHLAVGFDGDLVAFDEDISVKWVFLRKGEETVLHHISVDEPQQNET